MLDSGGAVGRVTLNVRSAPLMIGPEVSVPLGLIATELVANTLEHGFPGDRRGQIEVSLDVLEPGRAKLRICDDGRGVPGDFDINQTKSLGLSIARQFARQLGGALEILARPEGGTEARLEFTY
jgi:two-component sensor histidine kinase